MVKLNKKEMKYFRGENLNCFDKADDFCKCRGYWLFLLSAANNKEKNYVVKSCVDIALWLAFRQAV